MKYINFAWSTNRTFLELPSPIRQFRRIHTLVISIIFRLDLFIQQMLSDRRALVSQMWHIINRIHSQAESISSIADGKLEWSVDIALFSVPANMNIILTLTLVCQAMNQPWVGMEVENARFVVSEEGLEFDIAEAMGVVGLWDQLEQVDNVHESDFKFGQVLAEKSSSGERFLGWNIAARGHDKIRFLTLVGGSPLPDASTLCAMCDSVFHVEILEMVLLVGNNHIDVVRASETMIAN